MASYTLCDCILSNIELDKKYITDLLMVFTQQTNPFKVAIDKSGCIIDRYEKIAGKSEIISTWLFLMTMKPSSFETINIDVSHIEDDDEVFLEVCSSTKNQQKTFVNSHERWRNVKYISPNKLDYDNKLIFVYDRDEAIHELHQPNSTMTINALNSTLAIDGSTIEDSKNITK